MIKMVIGIKSGMFFIKELDSTNIHQLVNLSDCVGWDYGEEEIETVLTCGGIFGHIDETGNLLSSAAIIPFGIELSSIGMVIVHPDYRGLRLGKSIMEAIVQSDATTMPKMLISTDEGKPLYEKIGFRTVSYVHKYICPTYHAKEHISYSDVYSVRLYQDNDFSQITKLDRNAVGIKRSEFLKVRIHQSKETVVVKNVSGELVGFGLSIETKANLILGPIVALNDQIATIVIHNLSKDYDGKLRIDIPEENKGYGQYLERLGFEKVAQPPIMLLGATKLPKRNNTLYGIAAQIFG
jgi:N-acetylglutamate synthase-like GNAT family acetyltransferase